MKFKITISCVHWLFHLFLCENQIVYYLVAFSRNLLISLVASLNLPTMPYHSSISSLPWRLWDYFLGRSIRNINYTKFKTKENLNILTSHKKINTKTQIHKVSYFKTIAQYLYYQSYDLHIFQHT